MSEPRYPPGIRRLLRLLDSRDALARDVDDEIRFHIDARTRDLVARGIDSAWARETAEREYGDVARSHRELMEVDRRRHGRQHRREILMSFIEDIRYAARGLLRHPALMALSVSALTIGIAANAVMFGVIDQLLLRPPAYVVAPDAVKRIYFQGHEGARTFATPVTSYPMITAIRAGTPSLDVATLFRGTFTLGRGVEARSVDAQLVSGNYFSVLGVVPALGRPFTPAEDDPAGGAHVAVVSDGFWRRELGGTRDAIGRVLLINGKPFTVIGVAPRAFSGIDRRSTDMWVPVSALVADAVGRSWYTSAGSYWVQAIGRLRPGAAPQRAESQATAAYRAELRTEKMPFRDSTATVVLGSLIGTRTPTGISAESKVSLWLMGVAVIVLLIACANVANLLIARTIERRREIAVRLALGVSRARLLRQLLTEAALLAAIAAVAAVGLAYFGSRLVEHTLLPGIVWTGSTIDIRVLAFTLGAAIVCILLAGAVPAAQGIATDVSDALKSSSRQVAGSKGVLRFALLAMQAALSVVLLVGAGLFVSSLRNVTRRDVGIDFDHTMVVTMNLDEYGFERPRIEATFRAAVERAKAVPGVRNATMVWSTVPSWSGSAMSVRVPGVAKAPALSGGGPYYAAVTDDFFPTIGARILRGRAFTRAEERAPSRVMIVNQMLADAYWPHGDAIGQCVGLGNDSTCTQIVGIAQNVMLFALIKDDRAMIYLPPTHPMVSHQAPAALIVRSAGEPGSVIPDLHRAIQSVEPNMPFVQIVPFAERVAPELRPWRLGATMFTLFGSIALVIAAVGLYSVMAYWVSQRTREIGIRVALGARPRDVVGLVTWQASRAIGIGIVFGGAVAMFASRWVADMLYETSPRDPAIYLGAVAALAIAGALASVVPARRSAGVDPATALRAE